MYLFGLKAKKQPKLSFDWQGTQQTAIKEQGSSKNKKNKKSTTESLKKKRKEKEKKTCMTSNQNINLV